MNGNAETSRPASGWRRLAQAIDGSIVMVGHALGRSQRLIQDARRDYARVAAESSALYGAARDAGARVSRALEATPRLARVSGRALEIVASYRLHLARASYLEPDQAAAALEALHRANAERARRLCVEAGGGLVKIGQLLSCRADLLPRAWVEALSTLQDAVPPADAEAVVARVEAELGAPLAERFARFDLEPVASASLAQVHFAELPDETPVAVKVLRPGIEAVIDADIATLGMAAASLGDLGRDLPVATIAREVGASLRREVDLAAEAEALRAFGAMFADDERVAVPAVVEGWSTRGVLTMSRLEGTRLTDFLDACEALGEDGRGAIDEVFATLVDSFAAQILTHGRFHADPHPGNLMVLEGPRLGLLDFGAVEVLEPDVRRAYGEVMGAILRHDAARLAEVLAALGFTTRGGDGDALEAFAAEVLEMVREQATNLAAVDPMAQLEQAMALARANPVVELPGHFVMLGRVLSSLGGPLLRYRPRTNLFAIVAGHVQRATRRDR